MSMPIPEPSKYEAQTRYFHVIVKDGEFTDLSLTYKTRPEGNTMLNLFLGLLKELKPEHTWTLDKEEVKVKAEVKPRPTKPRYARTKQDDTVTDEQRKKIQFYTGEEK